MGKLDRILGAFCVGIAACVGVAAFVTSRATANASQARYAVGLAQTPGSVTFILALLTAIPGIFLLWRGRSV